jgi:hypothetical protein
MILHKYKLAVLPMALSAVLAACSRDEAPSEVAMPEAAAVVGAAQNVPRETAADAAEVAAFRTYLDVEPHIRYVP